MTYADQADLSMDEDFRFRLAACVAKERPSLDEAPVTWAVRHQWRIAASPGFAEAYASAKAGQHPREHPGRDTDVITDAQLLAAVQVVLTDEEGS